jgi:hypothetical protein
MDGRWAVLARHDILSDAGAADLEFLRGKRQARIHELQIAALLQRC